MEVSGEIGIFEGQRACAPLNRHVLGWRRYALLMWMGPIIVLDLIGQWLVDLVFPGWGVVGIVIATIVGIMLMVRSSRRLGPQAWMRRGVPASFLARYSITGDALVIESPHTQTRLSWSGLSEIIPGNQAWLFVGRGTAYFLPRRFFSEPGDEAAFLSACLDHMTPEARALSTQASRVATAG